MGNTDKLNLSLFPASEWSITLFSNYINKMSGDDGSSNMQIIDKEFGDIIDEFYSLADFLSSF